MSGEDGYEQPGNKVGKFPRSCFRCVQQINLNPQEQTNEEEQTTATSQGDDRKQPDNRSVNVSQHDSNISSVTIKSAQSFENEGASEDTSRSANWDAEYFNSSDSGVHKTREFVFEGGEGNNASKYIGSLSAPADAKSQQASPTQLGVFQSTVIWTQ